MHLKMGKIYSYNTTKCVTELPCSMGPIIPKPFQPSSQIDRFIKLRPNSYWPITTQWRSNTKVRHACAWRVRQSCAERHWRAPRVLAHTCVPGGAYWIGLLAHRLIIIHINNLFLRRCPLLLVEEKQIGFEPHSNDTATCTWQAWNFIFERERSFSFYISRKLLLENLKSLL